jgi:hypothetical protein
MHEIVSLPKELEIFQGKDAPLDPAKKRGE